jgi:hypothetical protein
MAGLNTLYTGLPLKSTYEAYCPLDRPGFGLREDSLDRTPVLYEPSHAWHNAVLPLRAVPGAFTLLGALLLVLALPSLWRSHKAETGLLVATLLAVTLYGLYWFPDERYGFVVLPLAATLLAGGVLRLTSSRWGLMLVSAWAVLHFLLVPGFIAGRTTLSPTAVAQPAELDVIASSRQASTLVFLSPPMFPTGLNGPRLPRLLGAPCSGLGALIPDPELEGPLVVAVDRGEDENAKVIARLPGRRVLRATYDAKGEVVIQPYTRPKEPK